MPDLTALPSYTYIPGGPWPHPRSNPQHAPAPHDDERAAFDYGCRLFDAGYYWEAHEVWEQLWHARGRQGATADVLKALIKLAASGVKVRQHQPHGVRTHALRAAKRLGELARTRDNPPFDLDLNALRDAAERIAQNPPTTSLAPSDPPAPVLPVRLRPSV